MRPAVQEEKRTMHSKEYEDAKKEFKNCLIMSPFCFFISIILAFTEWRPIMRRELQKEREQARLG